MRCSYPSQQSLPDALEAIKSNIGAWSKHTRQSFACSLVRLFGEAAPDGGVQKSSERQPLQARFLQNARENAFHDQVIKPWNTPRQRQRVLGHIVHSPRYWTLGSLIIYRDKIDWAAFTGNVVHLGTFRYISPRPSSGIYRQQVLARRIRPKNASSPRASSRKKQIRKRMLTARSAFLSLRTVKPPKSLFVAGLDSSLSSAHTTNTASRVRRGGRHSPLQSQE